MKNVCRTCKEEKDESLFNFKNKSLNVRHTQCKDCLKAAKAVHYKKHKDYYLAKAKVGNEKLRKWFQELKSDLVCEECGEDHPATIDFHHLDPKEKEFNIGNSATKFSRKRVEEELKKCKVLCANCHRKLHWNERMSG